MLSTVPRTTDNKPMMQTSKRLSFVLRCKTTANFLDEAAYLNRYKPRGK